nr:MAG TPA: hypothetical protein [Caudoviricetes sp.]
MRNRLAVGAFLGPFPVRQGSSLKGNPNELSNRSSKRRLSSC